MSRSLPVGVCIAMLVALVAACASPGSAGDAALDALDASMDLPAEQPLDARRDGGMDAPETIVIRGWDGWSVDAYQLDLPPAPLDVAADYPRCTPSSYAECPCADGGVGFQNCDPDTGVWRWCNCEGAPPPATELPPRLIGPVSGLRVTSQRPTLRWEPPAGIVRARVELCEDLACARRLNSAEVTGRSWRPTTSLRPGAVFWRVLGLRADGSTAWTSATWEFFVRRRDTPVDTAWGGPKDFDGDGYDDLVVRVGSSGNFRSEVRFQGLAVFRGSPGGLVPVPASQITGRAEDRVVPCLGPGIMATADVNEDGLADLVVSECGPEATLLLGTRNGNVLQRGAPMPTVSGFTMQGRVATGADLPRASFRHLLRREVEAVQLVGACEPGVEFAAVGAAFA